MKVWCACGRKQVEALTLRQVRSCRTPACDAKVLAAAKKGHKT